MMNQYAGGQESTTALLRRGSMDKPKDAISFPNAFNVGAQVQQLRVASQPSPISTLKVPRLQNTVPSVPKPVSGIRVNRVAIPGTNNVKVNVRFHRNPSDPAYQSANVYLKQANGTNGIVQSTANTQTTFVVPKTGAASVVTVQSVGSGAAIPVSNSPGKAVNLL